ncbi:Ig-like domain-containing protein, partial [Pseudomonas agarici]
SVKWSPQVVLKVNIGNDSRPRLPYAYIDESTLGEEFDTLDYDVLGEDNDATLVITQVRQGYLIGDALHITLEGRTADGTSVHEVIDFPIPDDQIGRNTRLPLRNEIVRELVGGTAVLSYERIRAGSEPQPSELTRLAIIGSFLSRLARPLVLEAVGDFLDPTSLLATVEISPYTGQQSSDRVDLYLLGTRANGEREFWHFFKMAGSSNAPVLFYLQHDLDLDIAGLNGGKLELHYLITNAEGERESFHTLLSVGEAAATLPAPNVPEAPGGVLDPEASIRGATVVVPRAADLEEGDLLSVYWQGSKPGGSFIHRKFEVTSAWLNSDIPFPIEREYVDANKGGSVKAFYIVERGREPVRYSHTLNLRVGANLALKPPEVLETIEPGGNVLNPINAQTAVTIRVRYDDMKNSDNIQPYWKGIAGIGSPVIEPKPGNAAQGYVDFTLSGAAAVGANIGKVVEVSYEVTNSEATQSSDPLNLTIQSIPVSELPPLQILEANAGQVDVNGTVTFRVDAWPFYRQGDRVWLALESDNPDGTPNRLPIWTASPISASEFNQKFLTRVITSNPDHTTWLRALEHGSELRVIFKVVFGGGSNEADALTFPLRTYTVHNIEEIEAPTITSVKNAAGGEIANGSTVVTATVTLTGTAPNGQQVEIRDGTNTVMHTATANGSGIWATPALPVTAKGYSITARGLYASNPVSTPPRTFTVVASATPTITSVKNAAGGEIANGSTVVTATVTLTGTAPNGQQVEIRDGTNVMGTATANASGVWTSSALTVTAKAYSITARGLYGTNPVSTPARTFTVTALVTPTLTSVKDPKGAEVAQGTTTREKVFTLTGTASKLQRVQIEDGNGASAAVLGTATANASGIWTFTTSTRPTGERRLYARSLYHPSSVFSNVRTFTIADEVKPVITGVHTSTGASVPHNGTTNQRSLTISGTATPNSTIEVRDGTTVLLTTSVNNSRAWSGHINNLSERKYNLIAKIVGGTLSSDTRSFTVQLHPPLAMNTSPMVLNGRAIRTSLGWPQTGNDFVNNTATRTPTAGSGSYAYSSNNISIAPVSNTGKVTGLRNGSARITVRDEQTGQSLGYDVTVSNVWELNINNSRLASHEANTWRINRRGINLIQSDMDLLKRYYTSPFPRSNLLQNAYWCDTSSASCSVGYNLVYSATNGNVSCGPATGTWGAFCITSND